MDAGMSKLRGDDSTPWNSRLIFGAGVGIALTAIDIVSYRTNISILFPLVLLLFTRGRRSSIPLLVTLLVCLTYLSYLTKYSLIFHEPLVPETPHRIFNRTLVALSIIVTGGTLDQWIRRRESESSEEVGSAGLPIDDLELSINQMTTALMCAAIVVIICVTDVLAPKPYNLAILYPIPLLIAAGSGSRFLVWAMVPVLLLLTLAGGRFGMSSGSSGTSIMWNRSVDVLAILGVAFLTTLWPTGDRPIRSTES